MHPQPFKIRHSLVLLFSLMLLSGCQPPASGESAGLRYPVLYMQLQQTTLPQQLPMPVQDIKPRQIQDTWGAARSEGRKHQGIDIFAKCGTAVLSTTQGIVAKVGLDSLGGKVVWIIGPDLTRHYYAHLDD